MPCKSNRNQPRVVLLATLEVQRRGLYHAGITLVFLPVLTLQAGRRLFARRWRSSYLQATMASLLVVSP